MPHYTDQTVVVKSEANGIGYSEETASTHGFSSAPQTQFSDQRDYRSDAPAPSENVEPAEPVGDNEPLLREMRIPVDPSSVPDPPGPDESSSFHTSFQDIGKRLKACNDTLGELQGLGVSHDVPLPELVLVGDQSAGKSSVMSGLANLDLPRSEGTCTRCPLHIRVSRNTEWSCRVSLSKEYRYKPPAGRAIDVADVTDEDPFFPWQKQNGSHIFEFKTVHDKSEIEEVLRWAQVAILNDDKQHELFVPGLGAVAQQMDIEQASEETAAKFSPNVVFLEIKGPELPNLSFYDMPGIFQNPANASHDYLVNVVRNLSMSYIMRQSAIILCSTPMNTDAENSFTFGLVRRLGATGRTIGVLTKADLLPEGGNHAQWLEIMRGTSHSTGLGYYITSRPQKKSLDQLRRWEEAMFESDAVDRWPSAFHQFTERCGVERLKSFLSNKLGEQFVKSLPQIKAEVRARLDRVNRELSKLPELPENVELEIKTSLHKFADVSRGSLDKFSRHLGPLPHNFRDCIIEIKPKFILRDSSDCPVHEISDDSDESSTTAANTQTPSKRRSMAPPVTPSKRHKGNAASANGSGVKQETPERSLSSAPGTPRRAQTLMQPPFVRFKDVGRGFRTIRQVREEIQQRTRSGMPNHIPEDVYESLALEAMRPWNGPMMAFITESMRLVQVELEKALDFALVGLKKRIVYQESKKHLREFLKANHETTAAAAKEIYNRETCQLLTFNNEAFDRYREEEYHLMTRFRHKMRMEVKGLQDRGALEDWDKMTDARRKEDTKRREDEMLKIGQDQFQREVEVVSYIRGYYRLAALRFVDSVAQCVMCCMIPRIKDDLSIHLHKALGLLEKTTPAVYERLIEEDPAMALKRETLKKEKAKFEKALASIDALNMGVASDEDGGDAEVDMEETMVVEEEDV